MCKSIVGFNGEILNLIDAILFRFTFSNAVQDYTIGLTQQKTKGECLCSIDVESRNNNLLEIVSFVICECQLHIFSVNFDD